MSQNRRECLCSFPVEHTDNDIKFISETNESFGFNLDNLDNIPWTVYRSKQFRLLSPCVDGPKDVKLSH